MINLKELEQALSSAAADYSYETGDDNFTCLAKIEVKNGWADASIINGFTLTAEEVEIDEKIISRVKLDFFDCSDEIATACNLLTRIKQWQDEQKLHG